VSDLNEATSRVEVAFAQRNVALLFGSEARDDYDALKLAELTRDSAGELALIEAYVPPCLRIGASAYLMRRLRELLRLLVSKQRQLASRRRHRDASALEFTAADVTLFLELDALDGLIPLVRHALEAGSQGPLELYLELSRCAGRLCTFSAGADPSALPTFQFTDLRATFEGLFGALVQLLRQVARDQYLAVELTAGGDGLLRGRLEDERLERCGQFLLAVRGELPERVIAEQLPRLAKLSSNSGIADLVHSATPGIPLQVTWRPPPEIPVQPGVVYFSLPPQDAAFRSALRERALALYLPHPFEAARTAIELLAVPTASQ
jgi:type VI secretion system protein ImpJ